MFLNSDNALNGLNKGAFLTSGNNIMTIGWGALGCFWGKKVFIVPVRYSRYTKEFLDKTREFAVSIPKVGDMEKELKFCGKFSGRDTDKLAKLDIKKADKVNTFLVDKCEEYFQCKILAEVPIDKNMLGKVASEFYKNGDYHILYIGEILE